MARLTRMDEGGGLAGGRQRRGDLAADMAGLAHAGDNDAAGRCADQGDGVSEPVTEAVEHQGRLNGRDAGAFEAKGAERRGFGLRGDGG